MKLKIRRYYLVFISLTFILSSCLKQDDDSLEIAAEKQSIEKYLTEKGKHITPTNSGLYFEITREGQGNSPLLDDFVLINFKETNLDGKLLDTSDKNAADSANIVASSKIDGPLKLYLKGIRIQGLVEGLLLMKEGTHAWMLMPSSLTFYDYMPRIFDVELVKVIDDPVKYEEEKIAGYLDALSTDFPNSRLSPSDSTSDGIYYIETLAGTGDYPVTGDNVTVNFTANLIEGQLIDETSVNYSFKVGDINIISGLNAGVQKMKKGGKAILIIPFRKAFGPDGIIQNNIIEIPMYATLVYTIELKNITR
jgi:FKBP-type peptidyl-prolyl cis-trans isomerase